MSKYTQITPETLARFKTLILSRTPIEENELAKFNVLDVALRPIFQDLYYGDIGLAEKIISGDIGDDTKQPVIDEMQKISGVKSAVEQIRNAVENDTPILCISGDDGHSVTALSINEIANTILEKPIMWEAQTRMLGRLSVHENSIKGPLKKFNEKGLLLSDDDSFLLISVGMGGQQNKFQKKIAKEYPKAHWIIIDHGLFDIDHKIDANQPNVTWVSPYSLSELSEGSRPKVSSGFLYSMIMKLALSKISFSDKVLDVINSALDNAGAICNKMALVAADIRIMPLSKSQLNAVSEIENVASINSRSEWMSQNVVDEFVENVLSFSNKEMAERVIKIQSRIKSQMEMAVALVDLLESDEVRNQPDLIKNKMIENVMKNKINLVNKDVISRLKVHFIHYKLNPNLAFEPSQIINEVVPKLEKILNGIGSEIKSILRDCNAVQVSEHTRTGFIKAEPTFNSPLVSETDWLTAFAMRDKIVQCLVNGTNASDFIITYRSSVPFIDIVNSIKKALPAFDFKPSGSVFSGSIVITNHPGVVINPAIQEKIFKAINDKTIELEHKSLNKPLVKVDVFNLDILMSVNDLTGANVYPFDDYQIKGLFDMPPEMTVKVDAELKSMSVDMLVESDPWGSSSISLNFDNSQRIILPTRLVKVMHDNGYKGGFDISQINKGVIVANGYQSKESLANRQILEFDTELNTQQVDLINYYENTLGPDKTKILTRSEMEQAIKFVVDPKSAFCDHEAMVLAQLDISESNALISLDIEGIDGGLAPKCFQLGMVAYIPEPNSGKLISADAYAKMKFHRAIRNSKKMKDGSYLINRNITGKKLSLLINEDDMAIPVKAEKLTNISNNMVLNHGMSATSAEELLLDFVGKFDKYITQAHNYLGYDLMGLAANFPKLYQHLIKNGISDTLLHARHHAIGQGNIMVSGLGVAGSKSAFVTTPGSRFNIVDKLRDLDVETFTFPDIKGESLLKVSDQDVYLIDAKTNSGNKLKITRNELALRMIANSAPQFARSSRSGIAALMKLATIFDVLKDNASVNREKVKFDSISQEVSPTIIRAFEKFQELYSPEISVLQNVTSFVRSHPTVGKMLLKEFLIPLGEQPVGLMDTMVRGVSEKTQSTKKFKESLDKVSLIDLLIYNAQCFVDKNKVNFSYGSESWLYYIVLGYGDTKNMSDSMMKGVSKRTGVPLDLIQEIIANTSDYMERNNLKKLFSDETHNNFDLSGDDFQESVVVSHLTVRKLADPFRPRHDVSQAVDKVYPFIVGATIEAIARQELMKNTPTYAVNGHAYKQLRSFDSESRGISDRGIDDKYLSFNISKSGSDKVSVRIPDISIGEYEDFEDEYKDRLLESVSKVVFTSMLRNSLNNKTPENIVNLVNTFCESDSTKESIKFLSELAPNINIDNTEQEKGLMSVLRSVTKSITGEEPISLPVNKYISGGEITAFIKSYEGIAHEIKDRLGVDITDRMHDVEASMNRSKAEFNCLEMLRANGNRDHEQNFEEFMGRSLKTAMTSTEKQLHTVDENLKIYLPAFATTMVAKKRDASIALLSKSSPYILPDLLDEHIPALNNDKLDDFILKQEQFYKP